MLWVWEVFIIIVESLLNVRLIMISCNVVCCDNLMEVLCVVDCFIMIGCDEVGFIL